MTKVRAG